MEQANPTINQALDAFLGEQKQRHKAFMQVEEACES